MVYAHMEATHYATQKKNTKKKKARRINNRTEPRKTTS